MLRQWCALAFLMAAVGCGGSSSTTTATPPSPIPTPGPTTFSLNGQVADATTLAAIAGATVSIADSANLGKSATTDGSGNYTFNGLQPAGFTVSIAANGYVSQSRSVTLTSNQTLSFQITRATPAAPPTFTLTGAITDVSTHVGVQGVRVEALNGLNSGKVALTDGTGTYVMSGLVAETFRVRASADGYEWGEQNVTVPTNPRADFGLRRLSTQCDYSVTPTVIDFTSKGFPQGQCEGGASYGCFDVTTGPNCAWTATGDNWVFVNVSPTGGIPWPNSVSGTGPGRVYVGVGVHTSPCVLTGSVQVRGSSGGAGVRIVFEAPPGTPTPIPPCSF